MSSNNVTGPGVVLTTALSLGSKLRLSRGAQQVAAALALVVHKEQLSPVLVPVPPDSDDSYDSDYWEDYDSEEDADEELTSSQALKREYYILGSCFARDDLLPRFNKRERRKPISNKARECLRDLRCKHAKLDAVTPPAPPRSLSPYRGILYESLH